jgi:hypothetical protein
MSDGEEVLIWLLRYKKDRRKVAPDLLSDLNLRLISSPMARKMPGIEVL